MDISRLSELYADTTEDLMFLVTVEGATQPYTFRLHSCNAAYVREYGLSGAISGRLVADAIPAEHVSCTLNRFETAVAAGKRIKYEQAVTHSGLERVVETTLIPFYDEDGAPESILGVTRDITERKQTERLVRESEARYRALVQLSPDAILMHDNGIIAFCNEACAKLVAASSPDALIGASLYDFVLPKQRRKIAAAIQRVHQTEIADIPPIEAKLVKLTGETIDVECTSALVEHGGRKLLQAVVRDVTKRSAEKERLQRLSQLDGLTNVANRRYFDFMLAREVSRARRSKQPISVLLFDIDNFKSFNDRYGHLAGDDCLQQIARAVEGMLKRPADMLARFGGEEFAVLLPDTDEYGAAIVAEQLRAGIESLSIPHPTTSPLPVVTISVGLSSMVRPSHADIVPLLERADRALYAAKRNGKNRVETYRKA